MRKKGKLFIISGPSGSGKTTLYRRLLDENKSLVKTVSITTRPRRSTEKHGRDYFFVSPPMFNYKRARGHFLEWQKVFDNFYGTPKNQVKDFLKRGKDVLLCIDVKGAKVVCRKFPQTVKIFIKTPTFDILKKRLFGRKSEVDESLELRLKVARQELREAKFYDYVIVNDNLDHAYQRLRSIVCKELQKISP